MPSLIALAVTPLAAALLAAAPAPGDFSVDIVSVNGSGCPGSSATVDGQPGDDSFQVGFSGYYAAAGGGASNTQFRRNCQFAFQITGPPGYTYAVDSVDESGYVYLGAGATGTEAVRYYFQGDSVTATASARFTGPASEEWQVTNYFDPGTQRYAPCDADRLLNLNTELRLTGVPSSAPLSFLVLDPTLTVHLTWEPCP